MAGHVAKGIQMGVDQAVKGHADPVEEKQRLLVVRIEHLVDKGRAVVRRGFCFGVAGEGHGDAFADQRRRGLAFFRGDQIERAALVLLAPAAPIRQLRHPALHILVGHLRTRLPPRPQAKAKKASAGPKRGRTRANGESARRRGEIVGIMVWVVSSPLSVESV